MVQGLGANEPSARVGAAVTLRMFLQHEDEKFYGPVFDLASAQLKLLPPDESNAVLRAALATVFRESFKLARTDPPFDPADERRSIEEVRAQQRAYERIDGSGVQLNSSYHVGADYRFAYLTDADFQGATLMRANFSGADLVRARFDDASLGEAKFVRSLAGASVFNGAQLSRADFTDSKFADSSFVGANLSSAILRNADFALPELGVRTGVLGQADFTGANLTGADLSGASLFRAKLTNSKLREADLRRTSLNWADLTNADLTKADMSGADLSRANLAGANPEAALALQGTVMSRVRGLSKEQIDACRTKGAIID